MSTLVEPTGPTAPAERPFQIVDLNYISLYLHDLAAAVAFYTQVFGPPDSVDAPHQTYGWRLGATWLTLLPSRIGTVRDSNPRNTEFAIQVAAPAEVDRLLAALVAAGARPFMAAEDTAMYEAMRFGCVDDPFGVRIDVYCPQAARRGG